MDVIFRPEAEAELLEAQAWYESRSPGLGFEFARAVVPSKAAEDALHIAIATLYGVDYLLTWNCRHIANPEL